MEGIDIRTPREPDAAPETGRRAMVTSPARAVLMAVSRNNSVPTV
jgi:hypothetical protein